MKIHGFQKMTLLDYPGLVACTVFTAGCNMRCPFCHNAFLVTQVSPQDELKQNEILAYIEKRKNILDGVCVSGGEPLICDDTLTFLKKIKSVGLKVKLDTNGSFPARLIDAVESGAVDYVAMDIKNSFEKYPLTTGVDGFDVTPIKESISFLINSGVDYEFRTTVVDELHETEDFKKIGGAISGAKRYFLQQFVDSGNLISTGMSAAGKEKMEQCRSAAAFFVPETKIRGMNS